MDRPTHSDPPESARPPSTNFHDGLTWLSPLTRATDVSISMPADWIFMPALVPRWGGQFEIWPSRKQGQDKTPTYAFAVRVVRGVPTHSSIALPMGARHHFLSQLIAQPAFIHWKEGTDDGEGSQPSLLRVTASRQRECLPTQKIPSELDTLVLSFAAFVCITKSVSNEPSATIDWTETTAGLLRVSLLRQCPPSCAHMLPLIRFAIYL
jgi:hypothetical protein